MACRLIGVVLTDACNLRCAYCCAANTGRQLSWPLLRASLDMLIPAHSGAIEVTFTGGEPLLALATLRLAVTHLERTVGADRVQWRVLTNGLLLDDAALSFLDEHRFLINLSFDGVPAAQALRGGGTHEQLERLLGHLFEHYRRLFDERLKVCITLSPATLPYLGESVRYFLEKRVKAFTVGPVSGPIDWEPGRISELEAQFELLSAMLRDHYECTGEVPFVLFRKPAPDADAPPSGWTCGVAQGMNVVVDVNGETYRCLPASATYQQDPAPVLRPAVEALGLGPATAPRFGDRLAAVGDKIRAAGAFEHPERRYSSYGKCADCRFLSRCRICPLLGASMPGWNDMYRVPDFLCAFRQVVLAHRDRFPCQPTPYDFLSGRVPLSVLAGT